jgi:Cu+-exporting ATPase
VDRRRRRRVRASQDEAAAPGRRGRGCVGASHREGHRRRGARPRPRCEHRWRRSPTPEGLGVVGVVDGQAVVAGRSALPGRAWTRARRRPDDRSPPPVTPPSERGQTPVLVGWDGSRARAVAGRGRRGEADVGRGRRPVRCDTSDSGRCCSPATTLPRPPAVGASRSGSTPPSSSAEVLPADKVAVVDPAAGRGSGGGHGGRRRQRRRRPGPGRPGPGDGHGHRRGDRGERPHAGAGRPAGGGRRHRPVSAGRWRSSRATCSGRSPTTWQPCPLAAAGLLNPMLAGAAMALSAACSW